MYKEVQISEETNDSTLGSTSNYSRWSSPFPSSVSHLPCPPLLFRASNPASAPPAKQNSEEDYSFFSTLFKTMGLDDDQPIGGAEFKTQFTSDSSRAPSTPTHTLPIQEAHFAPPPMVLPYHPVFQAVLDGAYGVVAQMLMDNAVDINIEDDRGYSLIFYIMRLAPPSFIHTTLAHAPARIAALKALMREIEIAHLSNNFWHITRYTTLQVTLDFIDNAGRSPLMRTIFSGNLPLMIHLLQLGANPNFNAPGTPSPLILAHYLDNRSAIRWLKLYGAIYNRHPPLHRQLPAPPRPRSFTP